MTLDDVQQDALTELFNIGVGRAASALSEIVKEEITLSVPTVSLVSVAEVRRALATRELGNFSAVSQVFEGPFSAQAALVFPEANALLIVSRMLGQRLLPEQLTDFEAEAMSEVGNIILNACVSVLADVFRVEFGGGLPRHRSSRDSDVAVELGSDDDWVLLLRVGMMLDSKEIGGRLVFLLGTRSLQSLFEHVERYLREQGLR